MNRYCNNMFIARDILNTCIIKKRICTDIRYQWEGMYLTIDIFFCVINRIFEVCQ